MKTLVIHPKDESTDFLREIYRDKEWTVITGNSTHVEMLEQIKLHDRIVMLGHGTSAGLLGLWGYVISERDIPLLRDKQLVGIWCNADVFFKKHNLKGFYTGMIISEVTEANYCEVTATQEEVTASNTLLADVVKRAIDSPEMLAEVKGAYRDTRNPVIRYNERNFYHKKH